MPASCDDLVEQAQQLVRVPVDRQVVLNLRAKDVIHSFFVFETRIKGDAVPMQQF